MVTLGVTLQKQEKTEIDKHMLLGIDLLNLTQRSLNTFISDSGFKYLGQMLPVSYFKLPLTCDTHLLTYGSFQEFGAISHSGDNSVHLVTRTGAWQRHKSASTRVMALRSSDDKVPLARRQWWGWKGGTHASRLLTPLSPPSSAPLLRFFCGRRRPAGVLWTVVGIHAAPGSLKQRTHIWKATEELLTMSQVEAESDEHYQACNHEADDDEKDDFVNWVSTRRGVT